MTIGPAGPQGQVAKNGLRTDMVIDREITLHALADHIAAALAREYVELMEAAASRERDGLTGKESGGLG